MTETPSSPHLALLRNRIDVTRVPFSSRGSRLVVQQVAGHSRLQVRLAQRLTDVEPALETYRHRAPLVQDLCFVDQDGDPLDFRMTSHPHVLTFHTAVGDFGLAFQDERTLAFGLPPSVVAGLRFHVRAKRGQRTARGGVLESFRDVAYGGNREPVLNHVRSERDGCSVALTLQAGDDATVALRVGAGLGRGAVPFSACLAQAKARWNGWFSQVPPVEQRYLPSYAYAWWIMANNLVDPQGNIAYEAMMPSKTDYVGLWLWDCAMHALAYRHVDPGLARDQIRVPLARQLPDGMLPDVVYDEGVVTEIDHPIPGRVTKPPILAWAALKVHEVAPSLAFVQEIYEPLTRWNGWWFAENDDDADGLAQYNHPYSSGLDDSPLWDDGMPVESPDLNTYLFLQMESLARMADLLGRGTEAATWRRRAEQIVRRMIEDMWDGEAGLFQALRDERPIPVVTPVGLYPLWTGQLPRTVCDRLVAHLQNPDAFWGEVVIPTVARNDPRYEPETMWRGPVWANINYFMIEALRRTGRHALARRLRARTLDLVMRQPGIYEYYGSETGEPPSAAVSAFGWTAAVFIDLAVQASREAARATAGVS